MARIMPVYASEEVENNSTISLIDMEKVAKDMKKEWVPWSEYHKDKEGDEEDEKDGDDKEEKEACSSGMSIMKKKRPMPGVNAAAEVEDPKEEIVEASTKVKIPSAKYLYDAAARGDEKAYKEALAVRSSWRKEMMKMAESLPEDPEDVARMQANERTEIIAAYEKKAAKDAWKKRVLAKVAEEKVVKKAKVAPKKDTFEFKGAAKLAPMDKVVIAERLKKAGIEGELVNQYVKYALSADLKDHVDVPEFVVELAKAKADKETKTALLKSWLSKEANLSPEDKSRVRDYWANELGYQDKEWCSDIVEDVDPVKGA